MTIWRMRIACWIPGYKHTLRIRNKMLLSHCNNGYTNKSLYVTLYVIVVKDSFPPRILRRVIIHGNCPVMMKVLWFLHCVVHVACPDFSRECISSFFMVNQSGSGAWEELSLWNIGYNATQTTLRNNPKDNHHVTKERCKPGKKVYK